MGRRKDAKSTIRWTDKNREYLTRLGYLDGRTGRTKNNALNLSEFVNHCVTEMCEANKHPTRAHANDEELQRAWLNSQRREIEKQQDKLQKRYIEILQKLGVSKDTTEQIEK